jgi:1,4-dihydroxy-6-naphthoate synthase
MHFAGIVDAVTAGEVDAGVIIHETRFTYATRGLTCIRDLGAWWEEETGLPIPLGGIVARRTLGSDLITALDEALRASVLYAREHPEDARNFVRAHARELSEEVTGKHIGLYVNEFTVDLGEEGQQAILRLLRLGQHNGVFPKARPGSYAAASIFR